MAVVSLHNIKITSGICEYPQVNACAVALKSLSTAAELAGVQFSRLRHSPYADPACYFNAIGCHAALSYRH